MACIGAKPLASLLIDVTAAEGPVKQAAESGGHGREFGLELSHEFRQSKAPACFARTVPLLYVEFS